MTQRVLTMLEQVSALKDYLEENAEELTDEQAKQLGSAVASCWTVACRRRANDRRS